MQLSLSLSLTLQRYLGFSGRVTLHPSPPDKYIVCSSLSLSLSLSPKLPSFVPGSFKFSPHNWIRCNRLCCPQPVSTPSTSFRDGQKLESGEVYLSLSLSLSEILLTQCAADNERNVSLGGIQENPPDKKRPDRVISLFICTLSINLFLNLLSHLALSLSLSLLSFKFSDSVYLTVCLCLCVCVCVSLSLSLLSFKFSDSVYLTVCLCLCVCVSLSLFYHSSSLTLSI